MVFEYRLPFSCEAQHDIKQQERRQIGPGCRKFETFTCEQRFFAGKPDNSRGRGAFGKYGKHLPTSVLFRKHDHTSCWCEETCALFRRWRELFGLAISIIRTTDRYRPVDLSRRPDQNRWAGLRIPSFLPLAPNRRLRRLSSVGDPARQEIEGVEQRRKEAISRVYEVDRPWKRGGRKDNKQSVKSRIEYTAELLRYDEPKQSEADTKVCKVPVLKRRQEDGKLRPEILQIRSLHG